MVERASRRTSRSRTRAVLLVEDNADRRLYIHHSLSRCGCRVRTITTDAEARLALHQHAAEFDTFIVNAALPGGFGIRLAMMAQERGLFALVVYGDGQGFGGRKIKVYAPCGLVYRGAAFGIGPLLETLREATPEGIREDWKRPPPP